MRPHRSSDGQAGSASDGGWARPAAARPSPRGWWTQRLLFALAVAAGSGTCVRGEASIPVTVTLDPPKARVGDRIRLTVSAPGDATYVAASSEGLGAGASLGPFRVVDASFSPPRSFVLTLTAEETGTLEIPSFGARFRAPDGAETAASVPARKVTVASVLAEGDASLADLKGPAEFPVPWPWKEIALVLAAVGALAAAAYAVRRRLRRPKTPRAVPEHALPPGVTPDLWARTELEALLARGLFEAGLVRELHIQLADLARRYLELRFRIPALERTTEEVAEEVRRALIGEETARLTARFLERCDRVKFAKHAPGREEVEDTIDRLRDLLRRTASAPPATEPATPPEAVGAAEGSPA